MPIGDTSDVPEVIANNDNLLTMRRSGMTNSKNLKALAASSLLLTTTLFCGTSQASLTDIGNGLIYDDVSDVTWISDGYAFTNNIAATTANAAADPYTGPLVGEVVTPSGGSPHTIAANDLSYQSGLGRWVGSWWAATAWADSFTFQYGSQTISNWRLPTKTEAQNLLTELGASYGPNVGPFTWVPPFYWTSTVTNSGQNADVAQPLFGAIANFTLINPATNGPRYSNVWAVVPGNVAPVPVPAAVWLFGSALASMGIVRRRSHATRAPA